MSRLIKIYHYCLAIIKDRVRPFKALIKYPEVQFEPGVTIGPGCKFGEKVKLYKNVIIANTFVGDYSYIGGNSEIKNCTIGKFCSIAPEVKIGLGIHPTDKISTYPGFYSDRASVVVSIGKDTEVVEFRKIEIGNDVWIGTRSMIVDSITIGNGAVIAAGSVVTKNVKPYEIVGGVPARHIKFRFSEEEIKKLEKLKWWERDLGFLRKNSGLFMDRAGFFEFIEKEAK